MILSPARAARPCRADARRGVERREDAERLDALQRLLSLLFQVRHFVVEIRQVFLVDEHLAPVLDQGVAGWHGEIAQERAAEERAAAKRELGPLPVRAVEALEVFRAIRNHLELPDDCDHRTTSTTISAVY